MSRMRAECSITLTLLTGALCLAAALALGCCFANEAYAAPNHPLQVAATAKQKHFKNDAVSVTYTSGKVSYSKPKKTLTIKNAKIISMSVKRSITLNLKGRNSSTGTIRAAKKSNLTVKGSGALSCRLNHDGNCIAALGRLTVNGGTVKCTKKDTNGGGVVWASKLTVNGGTLCTNIKSDGFYESLGTNRLVMNGGKLRANKAGDAAAILVSDGCATINGGTVRVNGYIHVKKFVQNKGTVRFSGGDNGLQANSSVKINGGKISGKLRGIETKRYVQNKGIVKSSRQRAVVQSRSDHSLAIAVNGGKLVGDWVIASDTYTQKGGTVKLSGKDAELWIEKSFTMSGGTLSCTGEADVGNYTQKKGSVSLSGPLATIHINDSVELSGGKLNVSNSDKQEAIRCGSCKVSGGKLAIKNCNGVGLSILYGSFKMTRGTAIFDTIYDDAIHTYGKDYRGKRYGGDVIMDGGVLKVTKVNNGACIFAGGDVKLNKGKATLNLAKSKPRGNSIWAWGEIVKNGACKLATNGTTYAYNG